MNAAADKEAAELQAGAPRTVIGPPSRCAQALESLIHFRKPWRQMSTQIDLAGSPSEQEAMRIT